MSCLTLSFSSAKPFAKRICFVALILVFLPVGNICSQNNLFVSQYMHNRFAINSAFAGSDDALSLFGSYRKQWVGFDGAPTFQFFSAHTPLKNEKVALGLQLYNDAYAITKQTGFNASYTYRIQMANRSRLAFSINGGMVFKTSGFNSVPIANRNDVVFLDSEKASLPVAGFGVAWYGKRFFAGLSIPNFFESDNAFDLTTTFSHTNASVLLTAGYLFNLTSIVKTQPSVLLNYDPRYNVLYEVSNSFFINDLIILGISYRSTNEMVGLLGYQVLPQLRVAYSYDYGFNELATFNSGSHEISIHYDFGFKLKSQGPKFF